MPWLAAVWQSQGPPTADTRIETSPRPVSTSTSVRLEVRSISVCFFARSSLFFAPCLRVAPQKLMHAPSPAFIWARACVFCPQGNQGWKLNPSWRRLDLNFSQYNGNEYMVCMAKCFTCLCPCVFVGNWSEQAKCETNEINCILLTIHIEDCFLGYIKSTLKNIG
jgi:hypothetical protein